MFQREAEQSPNDDQADRRVPVWRPGRHFHQVNHRHIHHIHHFHHFIRWTIAMFTISLLWFMKSVDKWKATNHHLQVWEAMAIGCRCFSSFHGGDYLINTNMTMIKIKITIIMIRIIKIKIAILPPRCGAPSVLPVAASSGKPTWCSTVPGRSRFVSWS